MYRETGSGLIPHTLRATLLAAAVIAVIVMAACGDGGGAAEPTVANTPTSVPSPTPVPPTPTPIPTPTPEPTATPVPTPVPAATTQPTTPSETSAPGLYGPKELLEIAVTSTSALEAFRFEMEVVLTVESEGAEIELPVKISGDLKTPNMIQARMSMNLGFLAFETEIVDTGDKMYIKDPTTGEWTIDESSGSLVANPAEFIALDTDDLGSVTLARKETIDGVEHYVIEAKTDVEGEDVAYVFWVRAPDNLIARIEADGKIAPPEGQMTQGLGDIGSMKLAMSLSEYGKDLQIVAPVQPSLRPGSQPSSPRIGEPLADDGVLAAYAGAMREAGTAHVVGETTIKDSPDSDTAIMRQTFEGDGALDGDNRLAGNIEINDQGFAATIPFETRRVDGVEYELDPQSGQWIENPSGQPGILYTLFDFNVIGPENLVDPTVADDTVDGVPVLLVQAGLESDLPIDTVYLWIGEQDNLLRRARFESAQSGAQFNLPPDVTIYIAITANYSLHGQQVTVERP